MRQLRKETVMADTQLAQHGFHHIALRVADFDASVKFYTEGIGLTQVLSWGEGQGRAVMLDAGNGNYVELFAGGTTEAKPEGTLLHFALRCDDVDAAMQRALAAGAGTHMAPTALTINGLPAPKNVYIAFCIGPDGELIEFFHCKDM